MSEKKDSQNNNQNKNHATQHKNLQQKLKELQKVKGQTASDLNRKFYTQIRKRG